VREREKEKKRKKEKERKRSEPEETLRATDTKGKDNKCKTSADDSVQKCEREERAFKLES
jgi:hypothetical protein